MGGTFNLGGYLKNNKQLQTNLNSITDCAALAEAVTARREGIKEKLAGLLHKLDREESISRRILYEVSITRKLGSLSIL